jgi:hypothetical protein
MMLRNISDGHRVHRSWLVRDHRHVVSDHENELVAGLQTQGRRNLFVSLEKRFQYVSERGSEKRSCGLRVALSLMLCNVLTVVTMRGRRIVEAPCIKWPLIIFTKRLLTSGRTLHIGLDAHCAIGSRHGSGF